VNRPGVLAKTAQKHDYPSAAWRRSYARRTYARRTGAERGFATVKDPAGNDITRGWCRLMGLAPAHAVHHRAARRPQPAHHHRLDHQARRKPAPRRQGPAPQNPQAPPQNTHRDRSRSPALTTAPARAVTTTTPACPNTPHRDPGTAKRAPPAQRA
jgi:hypothetical protein